MTINPAELPQNLIYPEADPIAAAIKNPDPRNRLELIGTIIDTAENVKISTQTEFSGIVNVTIDSMGAGHELEKTQQAVAAELSTLSEYQQVQQSELARTHAEKISVLTASHRAESVVLTESQRAAEEELRRQLAEMEARHAAERVVVSERQATEKAKELEITNTEFNTVVENQDMTRSRLETEFGELCEVVFQSHDKLISSSKKSEGALSTTVGAVEELIGELAAFKETFRKKVVGVAETEAYLELTTKNVDRLRLAAEDVRQEERRMRAAIEETRVEYDRMHGHEQDISWLMNNDGTVAAYNHKLNNKEKNYDAARNRLDHAENERDRLQAATIAEQQKLDEFFAGEYPQKMLTIESLGRLTTSLGLAANDVKKQYGVVQQQKSLLEEMLGAIRSAMTDNNTRATDISEATEQPLIPQQSEPVEPVVVEVAMKHENGAASLVGEYNPHAAKFLLNQLIKTPADN